MPHSRSIPGTGKWGRQRLGQRLCRPTLPARIHLISLTKMAGVSGAMLPLVPHPLEPIVLQGRGER